MLERPLNRQQRWRLRLRRNRLVVPAEISFDDVETLIALGWLAREASSDRHAADLG
jgi:hypothetical protein